MTRIYGHTVIFFVMFGLAEAPKIDAESMKREIREITRLMLQIEITEEKEEGDQRKCH